ncbi:hypothetical protein D3C72_1314630 [compost metagenome]
MGIQDARHLHGQGGAAGDDPPLQQPLLAGTQHAPGVDPRMAPEPAVFVVEQGLQVQRRHAVGRGRIAPDAVGIGEGTQRRAVARHHQGTGVTQPGQRRREAQVQHQQQRQQRGRPPAQCRPQPAARRGKPAPGKGAVHRRGTRTARAIATAMARLPVRAGPRSTWSGCCGPPRAGPDGTCPPPAAAAPCRSPG